MRRSLLSAALVTALTMAGPALAAQDLQRPSWATGELEKFDAGSHTLTLKEGSREMTFSVRGDARFLLNGKAMSAADLAGDTGHRIRVRYTSNAIGQYIDRVDVLVPGARQTTNH